MSLDSTLQRFCDAWNRHDAAALASLWSEDGELQHPWGARRVGRDAIRELLSAEHSGTMSGSRLTIARVATTPSPDSVAADVDAVIHDVLAPNGRTYEMPALLSVLFVRSGEEWQIREMVPVANPRKA